MLILRQSACLILLITSLGVSAQCPITVDAGEDVYLCAPPTPTQLNGDVSGPYLGFSWSPTTGMTGSNSLTPTVTVSQTTSYVLTATAPDFGNNLVDNGDFEQGNAGFTSDYIYNPGDLVPEGFYDVLDNPQDDHPGFAPCTDHTSGSGNMMVVNGAGTPNQNVWCQTVPVNPNTQYVLSAWVTSVVASSPARLQFNINGSPLGPIFNAPGGTCNWQNFFQVWNSGGNSSATICIVNQNTTLGGNDFALDDIVFAPVCTVTDTVKVNVINLAAIASPPVVTIPCDGAVITLSGNGSSTGPNVTYEWTTNNGNIVSGANTLTPSVNAPGEYVLTVSYEVNGNAVCTKTATVNVILNPSPLSAWVTPPLPLGCGAPTTLLIGNSSQPAFSSYQWSTTNGNIVGSSDQKNCTVNQVGTYTLTVTNTSTGCTAVTDVTVSITNNVPAANANSNGIITCVNDTVPLLGTGSSTGPNITYSWTTITGQISGPNNTLNTTASAGGLYILHVTNTSNNCTSNDTVTVPANVTPPSVVGTLPPQISCDPNQDTISLFIYVGPPPFVLINWTTNDGHIVSGQYTPAPQANMPGTYSVSVFDPANGCYNFDTSQVFANFTVPMADILPADTVTCQSPSIVLEGSGSTVGANFSIEWTASNGGNIVSGDNTLTPTVNAAGDYLLILRDSVSLCADTAMVSVLADTNVVVAIANAPDTLTCTVNNVALNANGSSVGGNLTYVWSTGNGNISGGQNTPNPTASMPGTYQLLLTNNDNGCSATDLATVVQNIVPPPISIAPPDTLTCAVLSQTIQAQNSVGGNFQYQWLASNGGNITSGDNTLTPNVDKPGTYILTATNLDNGCTATAAVTVVLEMGFPNAVAAVSGPLNCVTQSLVLSSNGSSTGPNFLYNWSTQDGYISSGANTPNPTVTEPGTYSLQIANTSNGCSSTATVVVLQDTVAPIALILTPSDTLTCLTTQLELIGDGNGTGVWTTNNGHFIFTTGYTAQIDSAGVYVFTTTDPNNGCTATTSVEVFENASLPTLSINPPSILTCIVNSLSLQAVATGQSLQFDWQTATGNIVTGQNTPNPMVDAPGDYALTVTNGQNGCVASAVVSVAQDTAHPNIAILPPPTITCNTPVVTVEGQNLSLPGDFVYNWTASGGAIILSGNTSLSPQIGALGVVTFSCFDVNNGCESSISVNVPQNTVFPTANAGLDDTLSCLTNSLTINGSGSGIGNLSFDWQASNGGSIFSGGNSPTPIVDQAGTYTLTVTDLDNGCFTTDVVEVFNDLNAPMANAGTAATLTCAIIQIDLNATASTGSNFSYNWTASGGGNILNGLNTLTPTVNKPGVYTLAVTNASNGCIATSSVTVPENVVPPVVDAGASALLTCTVGSVTLSGSSSGGAATYLWTATSGGNITLGDNTLTPTVDQTGTYTFTATLNSNGCAASDVVSVGIDTLAPSFQIQPATLLTCTQLSANLNALVQQPSVNNYSAQWTTTGGHFTGTQNTLNTSVDAPGVYLLTIVSALNGCDAQQQVTVQQDTVRPVATALADGQITCSIESLLLNGNGSSTGSGYAYAWAANAGGIILNGGNTLTPTVGSAGSYTLTVQNGGNGCSASTTIQVSSDTLPPLAVVAIPDILTCNQNMVTLDAQASSQGPNFSASWATSGGHIVSGQGSFSVLVDKIGNYVVTVLNAQNGCTQTAQVLVQENKTTPGALILPAATLNCHLPVMTLLGSSPTVGALTYHWTSAAGGNILDGAETPTPQINEPGTYTLLVTNPANGCTSSTSLEVSEVPDPTFTPAFTQPNCHTPLGTLNFTGVAGGVAPYQYSTDGGQTFESQPFFANMSPGSYNMVLSDGNGCTVTEVATIQTPFLAAIDLVDIVKIEQGDSVLLNALTNIAPNQIAFWEWSPATGLSCTDCAQPWAKPLYSQYYEVNVEDVNGCPASDRILVQVSRKRHIYPPTVFSPNDDGENDRFTLYTKGVSQIRSLLIFDRWGEQVFSRKNFQPNDDTLGWDGTFRGSPLNPAVFVWAAEVEFIDGEVEVIYGDVTIVR